MERYHILKLGLAITFYAVYCIRPMLVYSLEADNEVDNPGVPNLNHEFFQYVQGVEGRPGLDYPVYSSIPKTSFSCRGIESGYYADLETDCQVFHICEDSRKISFLCPNGTIFQQSELICEWWHKVNCSNSPSLYEESAERLQNDVARRKLANRKVVLSGDNGQHGAIIRTEERASVRATQNRKDYQSRQKQHQRQKINHHEIPSNNDIEQIIEESESNNRYLANAQNILMHNNQYDQQEQKHPNHNYNVDQNNRKSERSRSRASKKDIDKETANYINTNYDKSLTRHSKNNLSKNSYRDQSQKDYYVQFGVTNMEAETNTENYQTPKNYFQSTTRNNQHNFSNTRNIYESRGKVTYSTEPSTAHNNYNDRSSTFRNTFGTRTTSRNNNNPVSSNKASTTTQATTKQPSSISSVSFIKKTTESFVETTTPDPFAYGTAVKERFSSYDGKKPSFNDQNIKRFNSKYQLSLNKINEPNKFKTSTPITTYSPPIKYSNTGTTSLDYQNQESGETQVTQESSSFVKSSFNSISEETIKSPSVKPYPNHRSTYSDVQELIHLEAPKVSAISSITPHLVTTQPINNGKPFVGSRVGSTILPIHKTTQSKYTYLPTTSPSTKPTVILGVLRHRSTTALPPYGPLEVHRNNIEQSEINNLFNTGNTGKVLPEVHTSTLLVTNSLPTETFNVGKTNTTLRPNILPNIENSRETGSFESISTELFNKGETDHALLASIVPKIESTTVPQFKINVPEQGSLNIYQGQDPVNEPQFIKKTASLLYPGFSSTENSVDHATVYGRYVSSTTRTPTKNTPYSPTVPTVTQSGYLASTTTRKPKSFNNQGIPIKFTKGQDKISIHLSKNVGGQTNEFSVQGNAIQPLKIGAVVRFGDKESSSTTLRPHEAQNEFYVTKGFEEGAKVQLKSKLEKPRPFAKSLEFGQRITPGASENPPNINSNGFPSYQISSARPFGVHEATSPTPYSQSSTISNNNAYENVDNMIGVLQEIANYNSEKNSVGESQTGFEIPPSVSPQTLHSLVQYFANELQQNDTVNEVLEPDTKEKITSLLTAMTVHGYNNLFNTDMTSTSTHKTNPSQITSTEPTSIRFDGQNNKNLDAETTTIDEGELLPTTSVPELRQLARNFSLALSSYLNDPNTFRKSLEGLRPTEPPLHGNENVESSTSEYELLNFSDADVKPSTPAAPSPTWGYILAAEANKAQQEDVKNSLNPDLHTADSQSFIPRFNNVQIKEKATKAFTDLPLNHWTSSPAATRLWQKALSVNPAVVNDHFETTLSSIVLDDDTAEPELFNGEVLPEISEPLSEVKYDLRELPPLALNATQVHGILIDFMNHTKSDEHNRLSRILKKLNTSEEEFLNRMQEIESNPLTKRLVLLLISECGANITQDLGLRNYKQSSDSSESLTLSARSAGATPRSVDKTSIENHSLGQLLHGHLSEEDQDSRALQLLNSLYTIASRFGKRR